MQVTVSIPDDLLSDIYTASNLARVNPEAIIVQRLRAATSLPPAKDRFVILAGPVLQQLEERLGGGQVASPEDLLLKVKRVAAVMFGLHEITLTQAEREEIKWRAEKAKVNISELIRRTAERLKREFFPTLQQEAGRALQDRNDAEARRRAAAEAAPPRPAAAG